MHQRLGYHTHAPQRRMRMHTPQRCVLTTLSHARCIWYCCILISLCRCWPRKLKPYTHAPQRHVCTHTLQRHLYTAVTCKECLILLCSRSLVQVLTAETFAPHMHSPQRCVRTHSLQRCAHTTLSRARCIWYCCIVVCWCSCWPQRLLHPTHRHHRNACIRTHPRDVCIPHCNMQGVPDVVLSLTGAGADRRDSCTPHTGTTEMHAYTHTPETCAYHTVTCKVCLMLSSHWLVQVLTAETLAPHTQAPQKCMHTDTPQRRVHTTL